MVTTLLQFDQTGADRAFSPTLFLNQLQSLLHGLILLASSIMGGILAQGAGSSIAFGAASNVANYYSRDNERGTLPV